jgi:hypothetical protein
VPVLALHSDSSTNPGFGCVSDLDVQGSAQSAAQIAQVWLDNPIKEGVPTPPLAGDLVCWSGWCGEAARGENARADVRTWSATGWTAFERVAKELDAAAEAAGVDVILRPHARHVLADPQSTLAWLRRTSPQRLKILLDPAAWLTPSMLETADDHLARAFESFTGHPAVWGTVLTGLAPVEPEDDDAGFSGGEFAPCPLGSDAGVLPLTTLLGAVGGFPLIDRPIVLLAEDFAAQRARLAESLGAERV